MGNGAKPKRIRQEYNASRRAAQYSRAAADAIRDRSKDVGEKMRKADKQIYKSDQLEATNAFASRPRLRNPYKKNRRR